jgi:ABC-type antimicrobial peptide transport system permease subunit
VPFAQGYQPNVHFHVRKAMASPAAEADLLAAIRNEVRAADAQLPILGVKTMSQHMDASAELWIVRAGAVMFSAFGALALFLAVIGIYGVKAYSVARRTREIGIRMALGARPGEVLWMILREGFIMILTGTALGLLLAAGVAKLVSGLLFDVGALDPAVFILVPLLLASAALLACWVPARRATKISPMAALRTE